MSRLAPPRSAPPATPAPGTHSPVTVQVTPEKIAQRAYEKWLTSGCPHGQDMQHWLEAEAELKTEAARPTSSRR